MAYDANGVSCISQGLTGNKVWLYVSADAVGDVDAADYFVDAADLGFAVGDRMVVVDTATPLVTDTWVSAVAADKDCTVTQDA